jgi:hypothetical protein
MAVVGRDCCPVNIGDDGRACCVVGRDSCPVNIGDDGRACCVVATAAAGAVLACPNEPRPQFQPWSRFRAASDVVLFTIAGSEIGFSVVSTYISSCGASCENAGGAGDASSGGSLSFISTSTSTIEEMVGTAGITGGPGGAASLSMSTSGAGDDAPMDFDCAGDCDEPLPNAALLGATEACFGVVTALEGAKLVAGIVKRSVGKVNVRNLYQSFVPPAHRSI